MRALANLVTDRVVGLPLVVVLLTDRCNSRCATCDYWKNGADALSVERARALAVDFGRLGVREVAISGGEPLAHPDWMALIDILGAGRRVSLLTNGLLVERFIDRLAPRLASAYVSVDSADPATYASIRGVDGLAAVCAGVRALRDRSVPVTLRCTVQRANAAEIGAIAKLAADLDARLSLLAVDTVNAHAFARSSGWNADLAPSSADLAAWDARVADLDDRQAGAIEGGRAAVTRLGAWFRAIAAGVDPIAPRCNAPRVSVVIGPDGALKPCYFLPSVERYGDHADLRTALNTVAFREVRRAQSAGEKRECATCVCALYRGPRALIAD